MKIKKIETLPNANVYNMQVENHHNFSVNGGFIVHNCDALRYFCVYWTAAARKPERYGKYTPDLLEDWENSDAKLREIMEGLYGRPY